jgi:hypothetical protein
LYFLSRSLSRAWKVFALLALFACLGIFHYTQRTGDDLASSYLGCRLVAAGQATHLYSYDPDSFADIAENDAPWDEAADSGGFTGFIHPYVQTPLWAYALRPLCTRTSFQTFDNIFVVFTCLSFAACIWLIARHWTPSFFNPYAIALTIVLLVLSQPFRYAMFLLQTHIFFFLATVAALIFARTRPLLAGLLLACAAAVKLTPAVLLIYWLLTRRWKAAASMALWSVLLWMATVLVAGRSLVATYLADIHRISNVLLIGLNNQSFAAWLMRPFYPHEDISSLHILPLSTAMRLGSAALMIIFTIVGGLIDRLPAKDNISVAPAGAMIALIAATIFGPIAWTHYSIILLAPFMVIFQMNQTLRSRMVAIVAWFALALNYPPLATDIIKLEVGRLALVRGQFYSAVLCLVVLGYLVWKRRSSVTFGPRLTTVEALTSLSS